MTTYRRRITKCKSFANDYFPISNSTKLRISEIEMWRFLRIQTFMPRRFWHYLAEEFRRSCLQDVRFGRNPAHHDPGFAIYVGKMFERILERCINELEPMLEGGCREVSNVKQLIAKLSDSVWNNNHETYSRSFDEKISQLKGKPFCSSTSQVMFVAEQQCAIGISRLDRVTGQKKSCERVNQNHLGGSCT